MELTGRPKIQVGEWCVNPGACEIVRRGKTLRLEVRTMRLLVCLADHAGNVLSIDELLENVWGEVSVSPDSVYQAVASLRRQLGDGAKEPKYIETVPKLGYRLVAKVGPWPETASYRGAAPEAERSSRGVLVAAAGLLCAGILGGFLFFGKAGGGSPSAAVASPRAVRSIAVLPFLDLTEGMKEEEFADGMTEELIDKLGKVPGPGADGDIILLFQRQAGCARRCREVARSDLRARW